jgi:murein L,D-transpeptidase YcbB/YkuD
MRFFLLPILSFLVITLSLPLYAADFSAKVIDGKSILGTNAIQKFYAEHDGKLMWVDGDELTSDAKDIVKDIGVAWTHGLNPLNYYYPTLNEYAKNGVPKGRETEIEILFSDAVIRYGQDISGMRISPRVLEEDTQSWSRGIDGYSLLTVLSETSDKDKFLQQLLPQDETYKRLSEELILIANDLSKNPEKEFKKPKYPGLLKPGMANPAIVTIRQKLAVGGKSDVYDDKLKKEVEDFQLRHGLAADGLIGQRSFDAINQTRTQKLVKLIANLERRRWVRRPMPSRYVMVNIPQMQLQAVEDSKVAFEMPVIIGRDKRPTNSFVDNIIGVRFNPLWYVPETIKNEDYLPALQKDPHALEKKGIQFRVKGEDGMKKISPTEIDWAKMDSQGLKSIQMYQDSGDENSLGLIRVLMPNQYDIYLHDTNAPELFKKDDRALSSGCVRMSEPSRMANFILGKNNGWDGKKVENYIASHKLIEIKAEQPLAVYLLYYTAWLDKKDRVIIANDIYGNDAKLVQALLDKGKIPFDLPRVAPVVPKVLPKT